MKYKHLHCQELIPIHELNGIISFTKLFDTFSNLTEIPNQSNEYETISTRLIEMYFVFCLIWSIAASVNDEGRRKIDLIFREIEGRNIHLDLFLSRRII
jgi:dynein heavy chain